MAIVGDCINFTGSQKSHDAAFEASSSESQERRGRGRQVSMAEAQPVDHSVFPLLIVC